MTKSELIACLAATLPTLTTQEAKTAVDLILTTVCAALSSHQRVEIRDFGSFIVNRRAAHAGRNPKSGRPIMVPEKNAIRFKPGKGLRDHLIFNQKKLK